MKFMRERDAEYIFRTELEGKLRSDSLSARCQEQRGEEENLALSCKILDEFGVSDSALMKM